MAGIEERVKGFLDTWPIIEKHLNEILQEGVREDERLFHSERACKSLPGESENDLPETLG